MTSRFFPSLRRITSNGRYIAEIDGLRFIAIGSVLLYHVLILSGISVGEFPHFTGLRGIAYNLMFNGSRGVPVFFAISGMVLGLPFARQRLLSQSAVRLKPYLLRRVTRLEPPYIANLLLRLPFVMAVKHLTLPQAGLRFGVSLFYADWIIYRADPLLHPPSWSLAIEVQFYLLAPLLAFALFRPNPWARRLLSLAAITLASYVAAHLPVDPGHAAWRLSILEFAQYFFVGMLAADFYLTVQPRLPKSILWDVAAIPLWIAIFALPDSLAIYLLPPMLLVLIPGAFLGPALGRFFRAPFVATVGGMCYSIYLTHSLILQFAFAGFTHLLPPSHFWPRVVTGAVFGLPLVLLGGTLFFLLIERPCMDKHWPAKLRARFHALYPNLSRNPSA